MMNKILSTILALILLLALVPITASAETYFGTCGDKLTWSVNTSTGVLTIGGTGSLELRDFFTGIGNNDTPGYDAPWYDYRNEISTLNIGAGVIGVPNAAIYICPKLSSINVAEGNSVYASQDGVLFSKKLTTLKKYPPYKVNTTYNVPASVNSIEDYAFTYCYRLKSVSLPEGLTSLGDFVFTYCSSLTNMHIPTHVSHIGNYAFQYCSNLESINIPEGVDGIGIGVLADCTSLRSINIPRSAKYIGIVAFRNCTNLTDIVLAEGVEFIDGFAFENCSSLTSINVPASVTYVNPCAFEQCTKLESINVSKNNAQYSSVNGVVFNKNKTAICVSPMIVGYYEVPAGVTSIEQHAFSRGTGLTSVSLPEGVTQILDSAFIECSNLTNVNIPASVTEIAPRVFRQCSSLATISIPEGIKRLDSALFWECSSLRSIYIPKSVVTIVESAFFKCDALTDVYYGGSEAEWKAISVGERNESLSAATIHYNRVRIDADNDTSPTAGASGWAKVELAQALNSGVVPDSVANGGWQNATTRLAAAELLTLVIEKALGKSVQEIAVEHGWDLSINSFSDTNNQAITFLKYAGITMGVGDNNYAPNDEYNRGQMVTMIGRAAEVFFGQTVKSENPYTDGIPSWAVPYVGYAAENGITKGIGNGEFGSNNILQNQQTAIFGSRALTAFSKLIVEYSIV